MKGNYYLVEPLLDEKGEQVVRKPEDEEWFERDMGTILISNGTYGLDYPILVMKKFDHDPFERIKDFDNRPFPINLMECIEYATAAKKIISETVKELETGG